MIKTADQLLMLLTNGKDGYNRGSTEYHAPSHIVSSNDLSSEQINRASEEGRMYVNQEGLGFVAVYGKK